MYIIFALIIIFSYPNIYVINQLLSKIQDNTSLDLLSTVPRISDSSYADHPNQVQAGDEIEL